MKAQTGNHTHGRDGISTEENAPSMVGGSYVRYFDTCKAALVEGSAGAAFLSKRGISLDVAKEYGIGFDADNVDTTDGNHIGIANVKERISTMCKGTLDIDSRIDEGTTITISIPKEEKI